MQWYAAAALARANGIPRDLERATLDNGLRVILHPDRRLPLAAINVWYHVGSKDERIGRTGFAHLFEHMLFQGSAHVAANEHFKYLQQVGGVANGSTWYDRTNYYETVPAHAFDLVLWLESDRMGFFLPGLDSAKLETQRSVVSNERRQRIDNQPYGLAFERLFELLLPEGHPYRWPVIGTMEDIAAATLEEVRAFFQAHYGPNNAVLTLAGDFDTADALERAARWFGGIPAGAASPRVSAPLEPIATPSVGEMEDDVQLPRVYIAFRTPPFATPAWDAGALVAALLGDGKSSLLYHDLVVDRQIAQDVVTYLYPTEEVGVFLVMATAKPGVEIERLAEALHLHLKAMAEPPVGQEFDRARNGTLVALWAEMESLDHRADRISQYATFFDRPELAFTEAERCARLVPEDLAAFGAAFLAPERRAELFVRPRRSA